MLPLLERLLHRNRRAPATRVLVLVPTRELAVQVGGNNLIPTESRLLPDSHTLRILYSHASPPRVVIVCAAGTFSLDFTVFGVLCV